MSPEHAVIGPVDWLALAFPGPHVNAAIVPALAELVDAGTVRLIDAVVIHLGPDGEVTGGDLEDEAGNAFADVAGDVLGLMNSDDLDQIAADMERDTTTLVLVWENRWAAAFGDAVRRANGTVSAFDRVPRENVIRALSASSAVEQVGA